MTEDDFNSININKQEDEFKSVKHSVRHKQKERIVRKKRKKVNRLKSFLRLGLFILVSLVIYKFFLLSGWYLPVDTFKQPNSARIQILNNDIIPDYVLRQSLKDLKIIRLPIFLTGVKNIKKEIFKNPVIKKVYVRRYGFPARLQIIVRERVPIAIIKKTLNEQPVAFFTSDGILVLNKKYMNLKKYSDTLQILTLSQGIEKEITAKKIKEIENIVNLVETYSEEQVEYVDIRNPNDVFVKIQTTNIRLGTLDNTVEERIKRINTILPQINEVDGQVKYIDLSWDKVNYLKLKTKE